MGLAYISIGSNVGDREGHLRRAISALGPTGGKAGGESPVSVLAVSGLYESAPVGPVAQDDFFNAVLLVETALTPDGLLELLHTIENEGGRERELRWGPRTLDMDILLYDDLEVAVPGLVIPHPEMENRRFVLEPLLEIAPGARLPDGTPLRASLDRLGEEQRVRRIGGWSDGWSEGWSTTGWKGGGDPGRPKGSVAVFGPGKVGTAMALMLLDNDYEAMCVSEPERIARSCAAGVGLTVASIEDVERYHDRDIILITTPDGAIRETCETVVSALGDMEGRKVIHMSGALSLAVLASAKEAGADVLCIHPLQTFADLVGALESIPGSTFGVTCAPSLREWARDFVEMLEGKPQFIRDEDKPLYHAAAVMASNFVSIIEYAALSIAREIGFDEEGFISAFSPLFLASAANVARLGPTAALTGPLSRGDAETVRKHLEVLSGISPDIEGMYRSVSRWALRLLEERDELTDDQVEGIRRLLERGWS